MICPNCTNDISLPVGHKAEDGGTMRKYHCWKCGLTFETLEQPRSVCTKQAFQATLFKILKEANHDPAHIAG